MQRFLRTTRDKKQSHRDINPAAFILKQAKAPLVEALQQYAIFLLFLANALIWSCSRGVFAVAVPLPKERCSIMSQEEIV